MTTAMEIHDSCLCELYLAPNGEGHALFHAFIYRSDGQVFHDAQESGWQNLRLSFGEMRIEGEVVDLTFDPYASGGELWVDGTNGNGISYLPANHVGEICFEVRLNPSFETLKIHARKITSRLEGPFELEARWDADGKASRA